jgi:hypothetical protein
MSQIAAVLEPRSVLIATGFSQLGVMSHLNWTTAYDVGCHAGSPVLTVNCASEKGLIGAEAASKTTKAFSDTDPHPHSWARRDVVDGIVTRRQPDE